MKSLRDEIWDEEDLLGARINEEFGMVDFFRRRIEVFRVNIQQVMRE